EGVSRQASIRGDGGIVEALRRGRTLRMRDLSRPIRAATQDEVCAVSLLSGSGSTLPSRCRTQPGQPLAPPGTQAPKALGCCAPATLPPEHSAGAGRRAACPSLAPAHPPARAKA